MIVDSNIADLICELEWRIGRETYNPNSVNGRTGKEGCSYRYPVHYRKYEFDNTIWHTKGKAQIEDTECIDTMKYKFGSNHLYIGKGIERALWFLEQYYELDFNQLEDERRRRKRKKPVDVFDAFYN